MTDASGIGIWKSDGTNPGTSPVADIAVGPESTPPQQLTPVGGTLHFSADDGLHDREPWAFTP
jgi:ELWxxDGT repeat protein